MMTSQITKQKRCSGQHSGERQTSCTRPSTPKVAFSPEATAGGSTRVASPRRQGSETAQALIDGSPSASPRSSCHLNPPFSLSDAGTSPPTTTRRRQHTLHMIPPQRTKADSATQAIA